MPVVPVGVVESDIGGVVAFRHREASSEAFLLLLAPPSIKALLVVWIQIGTKHVDVELSYSTIVLRGCCSLFPSSRYGHFVLFLFLLGSTFHRCKFRQVDFGVLNRQQPFFTCLRVHHRKVESLIRVTVHRDEHSAAADHQALVLARRLQSFREVELLKQRTDGIGHVFDDLPTRHVRGWRRYFPADVYGLYRQVRDGPRLQKMQLVAR